MKKITSITALFLAGLLILVSCNSGTKYSNTKIKTKDDSASYYLGMNYGGGIKQAKLDSLFNYDAFMKGINEAVKEDTLPVSQMEIQEFLNKYFADLQADQMERQYKDHKDENKTFMSDNARKDSVVSLPSGLQYIVLKEGNGSKPTMNDRIKVHYTGKLIDGTIFDSSYQRNEPAEFIVGQVIPGWVEALQLMSVGSKWRLFIPEELAYGSRAQGAIKPFSTLIFDVELIEIMPAK
jgi:FKBP-type peptidyl-prolyl cis-trans isomerase FklB